MCTFAICRTSKIEPIDNGHQDNGEEYRRSSRRRSLLHNSFNESQLTRLPTRRSHRNIDSDLHMEVSETGNVQN